MVARLVFLGVFALGFGAGAFGAVRLMNEEPPCDAPSCASEIASTDEALPTEFVKLGNQFVVSIVRGDTVRAVVVLSISVEVPEGEGDAVFQREPRLRAEFLKVLFEHAHIGGFDGQFTATGRMERLRRALKQVAQSELDDAVLDVLITEIARQEIG